jgi:hypothetical protein
LVDNEIAVLYLYKDVDHVFPEDGLKAGMNDSFNSCITASKYLSKLSHKM